MAKYRKKPVEIEAWKWNETWEMFAILEEVGMKWTSCDSHVNGPYIRNLSIKTDSGSARVQKGDWIIKGVKGEFYPCKPDIFEATYESV